MVDDSLFLLGASDVQALLDGRELEIIECVTAAYRAHGKGDTCVPHSSFLKFPHDSEARIAAMLASLAGEWRLSGLKWIASFPQNVSKGLDRASAVIVLNSFDTGRPEAIFEGSIISAKRTAASAALGARYLVDMASVSELGIIGCGVINFEIVRFLSLGLPKLRKLLIFDRELSRATRFGQRCQHVLGIDAEIAEAQSSVLAHSPLISFATTALSPYVTDLPKRQFAPVILHLSLRDLSPELIARSDNLVDDREHVCRAGTSVHLATELVGHREFLHRTVSEVLEEGYFPRHENRPAIFNPFGLGILDLAVAHLTRKLALDCKRGSIITAFLPKAWNRNDAPATSTVSSSVPSIST